MEVTPNGGYPSPIILMNEGAYHIISPSVGRGL